jgi:hypothetical protein
MANGTGGGQAQSSDRPGRLKHEWAMLPLRMRRIYRVRLHVDPTILAQLASALLATRTPWGFPLLHPVTARPQPCPDTEKPPAWPAIYAARWGR